MKENFRSVASKISYLTGTASAFVIALAIILVWGLTGPLFKFSDTWQLLINTGTTICTFLMVFLIQNTQNRDGKAMQLKLDELIRSSSARSSFIDLEDTSDEELARLNQEFHTLHQQNLSPIMHALHRKIEAEHNRRHSLQKP